MAKGEHLGEFEHLVLLAVAAVREAVHGRSIYEAILDATDRDVAITAVHVTLRRLEKKGYVRSRFVPSADSDGERPRKIYELAPQGLAVLRATRQTLDQLWKDAELQARAGKG